LHQIHNVYLRFFREKNTISWVVLACNADMLWLLIASENVNATWEYFNEKGQRTRRSAGFKKQVVPSCALKFSPWFPILHFVIGTPIVVL
jgi:hypothetical protein